MIAIWKFLQPLIGPSLIVVGTLGAAWGVYNEGKAVGRASYVDEIVACETRRAEDWAKLIDDRESLLAQKTQMLETARKEMEQEKQKNARLQFMADHANNDLRAARAALAAYGVSLRFQPSGGDRPAVSGDAGDSVGHGSAAEECVPCSAGFAEACADDALTVFRLQDFYRQIKTEMER
ncbi:MAG: hypothetical protein LBI35_02570 [Burkholderiales bacterium]|jgi:hypothetical protein|nr:hypothetical protein [Burkholderiales bacterium]